MKGIVFTFCCIVAGFLVAEADVVAAVVLVLVGGAIGTVITWKELS